MFGYIYWLYLNWLSVSSSTFVSIVCKEEKLPSLDFYIESVQMLTEVFLWNFGNWQDDYFPKQFKVFCKQVVMHIFRRPEHLVSHFDVLSIVSQSMIHETHFILVCSSIIFFSRDTCVVSPFSLFSYYLYNKERKILKINFIHHHFTFVFE
jgi:hypothetical protein